MRQPARELTDPRFNSAALATAANVTRLAQLKASRASPNRNAGA